MFVIESFEITKMTVACFLIIWFGCNVMAVEVNSVGLQNADCKHNYFVHNLPFFYFNFIVKQIEFILAVKIDSKYWKLAIPKAMKMKKWVLLTDL